MRQECLTKMQAAGQRALSAFAAFLKSPQVAAALRQVQGPSDLLQQVLAAKDAAAAAGAIVAAEAASRRKLAKELRAALGGRKALALKLSDFKPAVSVIWEPRDVDAVVEEFRQYLQAKLDKKTYLKIEP